MLHVKKKNAFNGAESMFHHEIFTFSSAVRDLLDLIPPLLKLSAHNIQLMILHPLNEFFVYHISVFFFITIIINIIIIYRSGAFFRHKDVIYIIGICCWTKCCLTTQIIQNSDHIKARWNLRLFFFTVTVKCIFWCTCVTFWWNKKLFRVLYNKSISC